MVKAHLRELGPQKEDVPVIGQMPEAVRRSLRALCQREGIPDLGLHALRHTAGTRLTRAGFQLQDAAGYLGPVGRRPTQGAPAGPVKETTLLPGVENITAP
ncbi:tyrosine-type recombinase/integrase [Deinococcus planocerae]|uniref:tyrosine-type recombinase/integrase n=1 Tax=Deinococcus planocerae TaxID=1737569 RepID=UPI0011AFABD4|nr:tyrosine-type recombinase/integrase [Deinococcus planocerae]